MPLISKFSCVFLGPIRFWSGDGTVINYVKKIYCIPNNPSLAGYAGTQILKQRGVGLDW